MGTGNMDDENRPRILIANKRGEEKENRTLQKEFNAKTAKWDDLWDKAYTERDPAKRAELVQEVKTRVREAEPLIDKDTLKTAVLSTLRNSNWDNTSEKYYYKQMADLGATER